MKQKVLLVAVCLLFSVLLLSSCTSIVQDIQSRKYTTRLLNRFEDDKIFQVKDVFDFEFDRAYVIQDLYISGETFVEKYGLDLSLDEMKPTSLKSQHRIVFVDSEGNFVFCFVYDSSDLVAKKEGFVVYPDTEMQRTETPLSWNSVSFEFLNVSEEDYY